MLLIRNRLLLAVLFGPLLAPSAARAAGGSSQECITANESAQDLRRAGKFRDARKQLAVCMADGCPAALREDCAQRLSEVDTAMPAVVFEVKDDDDNDVSAVRVTMDGELLTEKLDGTAISVDAGSHQFVFEAAGRRIETRTLVLREGDKNRHERVVLVAAPAAAASSLTESASPKGTFEQPTRDGSSQRVIGLVLGGAGAAGVVLGGIFGLVSKATYDHALQTECGTAVGFANATTCTVSGHSDVASAHGQAIVATVGFIGGAALLGGGVYLYLTAPKAISVAVSPSVGIDGASLSVRSRW